jgi:hypothetical protein
MPPWFRDWFGQHYEDLLRRVTRRARSASPDEQGVLVRELERVLTDPPYLAAYLDVVRPLPRPSTSDLDLLEDEQVERVVAHGLGAIPPDRVQKLALDLPALLALRDRIAEDLPTSDYWWRLVKDWAARRGALRSARDVLAAAGLRPADMEREQPARGAEVP